MELSAAGVLAAIAGAVFAARSVGGRATAVLFGAFVAAASVFARLDLLDVGALAFCVVGAALAALIRPRWWLLPPIAGGACAAAWISILAAQGLPWPAAAVAGGSLLAGAVAVATRRRGFMSAEMADEALVIVASFALLLAVGPDLVDGWRSSIALKAEPLAAAGPQVGPWLGALVAAVVLLGAAYTAWKRR